ncbi:hypothetical protein [Pararhizobium sp.]|uniref:hypothetical protein n=1 Tax=Pararhizobium sp. TaxID=1977563 RepID=UPI0027182B34|nr:hypothetical protein [Pararhizobium sp.]MDO9417408.1 hypothetical protein [Pararhizobium sp.]
MGRTVDSDRIRDNFLDSLKSQGASVETMADLALQATESTMRRLFDGLGRAGRDVYLVRGVGLINVHVRSKSPGWWNILKTVKEDLDILHKEFGVIRLFVLLIGRPDRFVADGYIITEFDEPPLLRSPGIEKTKYTINERQHLELSRKILSLEKLAMTLLARKPIA